MKRRLFYIKSFMLVIALVISSCSPKDLSRGKAEELLISNFKEQFHRSSTLKQNLLKKPEFAPLRDERFLQQKVVVTGISKVSETESSAEFKIVSLPNESSIRKLLNAIEKFQQRLLTLLSREGDYSKFGYGYYTGTFWVFTDPSDNEKILGRRSGNIKNSDYWLTWDHTKKELSDLIHKEQIESSIYEAEFRLYDDGWRLVKAPASISFPIDFSSLSEPFSFY